MTRPITPVALDADRSLELWAVPTAGRAALARPAARRQRRTVALRGKVLAGADTLAVSLEPAGGSPTGAPTGPIVYVGKFVALSASRRRRSARSSTRSGATSVRQR